MNKFQRLLGYSLILSLLLINPIFILNRAGPLSFGVSEGEFLEFTVVNKPERPEFTLGSDFPFGINISDIRALTSLTTENYTLQPIFDPIPPENTNFTIKILELDEVANVGKFNVSQQVDDNSSHGMEIHQLTLNNLLGEPIISTDWQQWIQVVESLSTNSKLEGKRIMNADYDLTNQTFKTSIIIEPSIPDKLRFYLTSVRINQTLCYYTNTGIQAYFVVVSTYSIFIFGDFTSVTYYKYVGVNSGLEENISIITKPFSPFQIFLPILGGTGVILIATASIILLRRRTR